MFNGCPYTLFELITSDRKQLGDVLVVKTERPPIPTSTLTFGGISQPEYISPGLVFNDGSSGGDDGCRSFRFRDGMKWGAHI